MTSLDAVELQICRGLALQQAGDLHGAAACFKRALTLDPNSYAAYNNLGNLFASLGDRQTALTFLQAAVTLYPYAAEIHNNIGNLHFEQEQADPAIASYSRAIALQPENAAYYSHLGNALRLNEQYAEAEASLRRAVELRPDFAEVHANLGFLSVEQGQLDRAEKHYRRAIELKPDFALAHTCLASLLLRRGEFAAGWEEQEWRWQWKDFPSPKRNFTQPLWRGETIGTSRLFLHAEQGFGDTIQFLRYVPMVVERLTPHGATIIVEVHPELKLLAASIPGLEWIARGEPVPAFDFHCPLMSLPLAFATTLATVPAAVPYLQCGRNVLSRKTRNLHVGLVWAGSGGNRIDRKRSVPLSALEPLFEMAGVSFYSLQRGCGQQHATDRRFAGCLPATGDFSDTAAFLSRLDLVVSVDTSVAHLAGALGMPVWVLLPKIADWRWLIDREDSPWYPTARLFRQEKAGEWDAVVARIADALARAVSHGQFAAAEAAVSTP